MGIFTGVCIIALCLSVVDSAAGAAGAAAAAAAAAAVGSIAARNLDCQQVLTSI